MRCETGTAAVGVGVFGRAVGRAGEQRGGGHPVTEEQGRGRHGIVPTSTRQGEREGGPGDERRRAGARGTAHWRHAVLRLQEHDDVFPDNPLEETSFLTARSFSVFFCFLFKTSRF